MFRIQHVSTTGTHNNLLKFCLKRLEDLIGAPSNGKDVFYLTIHTDGFGASVLFARRKLKENEQKVNLVIDDFTKSEMETLFLPVAVDPGRTTIFTATVMHSQDQKEFRTCSSKERRSFAGTDRRSQKVIKLKQASGVEAIESRIPTAKTIDINRMKEHIRYMLNNVESLFRFYNHQSTAFRFYDYQGRQRANDEMANILLNGGKKYNGNKRRKTNRNKRRKRRRRRSRVQDEAQPASDNYHPKEPVFQKSKFTSSVKVPVVVFGDGLKNKENTPMKGQLSGTSGVCLRSLYQRMKQLTAAVVMINEFNTSKVRIEDSLPKSNTHILRRYARHAIKRSWRERKWRMMYRSLGS